MSLVREAHLFAKAKHKDQKYGDKDYFDGHICKVVDSIMVALHNTNLSNEQIDTIKITAYLHDVMEDCGVTYSEIQEKFGTEIATYVKLLTKHEEQSRAEYLKEVTLCRVSTIVKLHDATVNATQCFSDGDMKRFNKYLNYIGVLGMSLGET